MAFLTIRRCCVLSSTTQDFLTSSSFDVVVCRASKMSQWNRRWLGLQVLTRHSVAAAAVRHNHSTQQLFLICGHSQWNQRWWWWVFMKYFNLLQFSRACRQRFDSSLTTCSRGNWLSRGTVKERHMVANVRRLFSSSNVLRQAREFLSLVKTAH